MLNSIIDAQTVKNSELGVVKLGGFWLLFLRCAIVIACMKKY